MRKVFLYLYPIEEYTRVFLFRNDDNYDKWQVERPLPILNNTIDVRYRKKGYEIIYVLYPDRKMFGIERKENDKFIFSDITFDEASGYNKDGTYKDSDKIKYTDNEYLINQLGEVDEIVIGGYHATDCVKKIANACNMKGIDTLIDVDLTDIFFALYRQNDYFDKNYYDPVKYRDYIKNEMMNGIMSEEELEAQIKERFDSPTYKMFETTNRKL